MISTDRVYGAGVAARLALRDYLALYPPRVLLASTLPRAVLQAAFLAYLGYYAGGEEGRRFALVGGCAQVIVLATIVRGPDVLLDDRWQGTLPRLHLAVVPLPLVVVARWWVFVVEGTVDALAAVLLVAPLVGEADMLPRLLLATPLFLLIAATTSAFGIFVAAFALTQRADVLITNLVSYLTIVACGVVAPISHFGHVGSDVVRALPLTNGLQAIRGVVDGRAWAEDAALEAIVGAAWLAVGVVLLRWQARRARRLGTDDRL